MPASNAWLHEMKYDGYRRLISVGGGDGRAYTRSGLDWTDKFAPVVADAATLDISSALLDGEAVVLDAEGRTSFPALQNALKEDPGSILYYAFDLLALDGEDLANRPLTERKEKLAALIGTGTAKIRYSDHIVGRGEELFGTFCEAGLEGVISNQSYRRRLMSGHWRRLALHSSGQAAAERLRGLVQWSLACDAELSIRVR